MISLLAGYRRLRKDVYPLQKAQFERMAHSQHPHTLFITCSDSRVVPSMFTQTEPGELFICRMVGNLIPAHGAATGGVVSAIEYAVSVLGVKQIVVCGHSDCGAMRAFLHPEKLEALPAVRAWLEHASTPITLTKQLYGHLPEEEFIRRLTQENVVSQMHHLRTHPSVAMATRTGKLKIYGWYFDIAGAVVSSYDEERGEFGPLDRGLEAVPGAVLESEPAIA
jgi:carbonic anhydrase